MSQQNTESKLTLGGREISVRKYGNCDRLDFSKIESVLEIPDLVEIQKNSYNAFLADGIREVFQEYSPICDYSGKIELSFLDHTLEYDKIKYSELECKNRDATYACPLRVNVQLINRETGEIKQEKVFMGDIPLMTPNGSFIINGAERVIVSQLVRSPGVYCDNPLDRNGEPRYATTVIPSRGAWLEFEEDAQGVLYVHVDRTRKVSATILLRSLGIVTDEELLSIFHNDPIIAATCEHDRKDLKDAVTQEAALVELNKRLRPGEIPTTESVKNYINNLLFDSKKYDLSRVGRYKFNKKLALYRRIANTLAAQDVVVNGVTLVKEGELITEDVAILIQNAGINEVCVRADEESAPYFVLGNNTVDLDKIIDCVPEELGVLEKVHYPTLMRLWSENNAESYEDKIKVIVENVDAIVPKHIIIDDIIATINYCVGLHAGLGYCDNIDHLGNRRVRSVGELMQNQFRIGIVRLERVIKERMQIIQDIRELTPQSLINIKPVSSAIKEFFGSSQLSQFMDQTNPISELTHKRKLSALGPGGLNRERASFEVRDVHYTHYGRMCPIETPEGQNIGLISSLATFARVNKYGFIEAPYRKVVEENGVKRVSKIVEYMAADDEDRYVVAQANEPLDENDWFVNERVMMRRREDIAETLRDNIDYMDVSPRQLVSVATSLVPFLENDDTNRALMGSNMQRQAVPLLKPEAPIIATGIEDPIAYDSGVMVIAEHDGVVEYVDADRIVVACDDGTKDTYELLKFKRSNQGTCLNQHPIVKKGDRVKGRGATVDANGHYVRIRGTVLADGHSTQNAELALGRNILIGFMNWEGYNYEDAILISEDLIKEDVFTSIHIEEYEMEARDTKLGPEEITRDIPNVGEDALKDLDEEGIIRVGATVRSNDYLVGKVTPKGETDLTPEERLLRAIFGDKARDVRDTSLRVPHGEGGVVVDVKVFTRANKDELKPGVHKLVRVYIAQKRKISVGDKMAGRHGNKGVISRVLPREDMPFMADGTPLQIVLNPLGVPSRMNIGQVLEVHLGFVAKANGWHIATPVFDGAKESDIRELFETNGIMTDGKVDGKIELFDGRTGQPFENRVTVGYMYMLKLIHLVDDKIHARSTGPYSLVTQQPLGGKAQFGGQRFGEMEVWALYAYGAANILQEIMTIKSDDVVGRVKAFDAIVKGENIPEPGVPESFKVLVKELQGLGLDVKVLSDKNEELPIGSITDEELDPFTIEMPTPIPVHPEGFDDGELTLDLDDFDDDEDEVVDDDLASIFDDAELDFVDDIEDGELDELDDLDDLDDDYDLDGEEEEDELDLDFDEIEDEE